MTDDELQALHKQHERLRKAFVRLRARLETMAFAVRLVLDARGFAIPDEVRKRVEASSDLAELEHWPRRAVVVSSAREIFDETP